MTSTKLIFSSNLSRAMEEKNISAKSLSKQTGISEDTLYSYKLGISFPRTLDNLLKISEALQVSTDFLLKNDLNVKFISMGANVELNKVHFATTLAKYRNQSSYTQEKMAELLNISLRIYQCYEFKNIQKTSNKYSQRNPRCELLVQISNILHISIEELIK